MILSGMSAVMASLLLSASNPTVVQPPVETVKESAICTETNEKKRKWITDYFKVTAYCPCKICSEGYGRTTSTGGIARSNHTIAVDPNIIPYGTRVRIKGVEYVAEDCGGDIIGDRIDVFVDTHSETYEWGGEYIEIKIREEQSK